MADHKGDPAKQPSKCTININNRCPHIENTYNGMDGERYRCKLCGESYFLDYDEMR